VVDHFKVFFADINFVEHCKETTTDDEENLKAFKLCQPPLYDR